MHIRKITALGLLLTGLWACQQSGSDKQAATADTSAADTTDPSCKKPDMYQPTPMALGMRAMYEQMTAIRARIEQNGTLKPGEFKAINFIYAEPTDTSVLTDEFYMRAGMFKRSFDEMFLADDPRPLRDRYNLVLNNCVNCHQENCPGPIKKIKKLQFAPNS